MTMPAMADVARKSPVEMRMPPTWLSRLGNWLRNLVGRLHDAMAPGVVVTLERLYGILDNKTLYCAVDLGIPDILAEGSQAANEIATLTNSDPDAVDRLLSYLVSRGIFCKTREGRYANNRVSRVLQKSVAQSWRDWVLFLGSDWNWDIFNHMPQRVREQCSPTEMAFGSSFFEFVNKQDSKAQAAFNGSMAAGSKLQGTLFARHISLSGFHHVCDVGGGTGSMLARLLEANSQLQGTVLDLPELKTDALAGFEAAGVAERTAFVGGNFFETVPTGCDLYTLFAVLHDWDDERCLQILKNISTAMAPSGRIMVVERPISRNNGYDHAKAADLLMLVLGEGGRERTLSEYELLFGKANLQIVRRTTLPTLFEVFELTTQ